MQKIRFHGFTAFILSLFMLLSFAVFPITTFAASSAEESIEYLYQRARNNQQYDSDNNPDVDAQAAKNKIIDYIEEHAAEVDPITIKGGYKLIEDAVKAADVDDGLATVWKEEFKEKAQALEVPFSNENGNADYIKAGEKTNILTWNNTEVNGESVSANSAGVLQSLIGLISTSDMMKYFTSPMCSLAIALVVAYGCIGLMNLSMERSVTGEAVTREFIKIAVGIWIIYNFQNILLIIINFGSWVLQRLQMAISMNDTNASNIEIALLRSFISILDTNVNITEVKALICQGLWNIIKDLGSEAGEFVVVIGSWFGNSFIQFASSLAIYSVVIEIAVRYIVTPLAIADMYSERNRSNAWQWLKKFIACLLTGAVMYLIIFATDAFKRSVDMFMDPITPVAINLTMIGMLARARGIANDIVGVH